jgi:hypothetical protein
MDDVEDEEIINFFSRENLFYYNFYNFYNF